MLIDANLLLFARDATSPRHETASTWLEEVLNGTTRVGLPWMSLVAFVRIATHPRVYELPLSVSEAWDQVEEWLDAPASWIPEPTDAHRLVLGGLLGEHRVTGNLVSDAHLAALAIEHGVELCYADSDFARFDGLRWRTPLVR